MGIDIEGMLDEKPEEPVTALRTIVVCLGYDWNPSDYEIKKAVCDTLAMTDKATSEKHQHFIDTMASDVMTRIGMFQVGVSTFGGTNDTDLVLERLIPEKYILFREEDTIYRSGHNRSMTRFIALGSKKLLGQVLNICNLGKSLKNVIGE